MGIETREIITEGIEYWSPPLKKHRYRMDSVDRRAFESNGTPSGILMEYIQERERSYSSLLDKEDRPEQSAGLIEKTFSSFPEETTSVRDREEDLSSAPEPKRKFRTLKRIEKLIYDDTAVRQGELEDEAFELLNQDGFYDEVLPVDYEMDNKPDTKFPLKTLLLYTGALALLIGIIIIWINLFIL